MTSTALEDVLAATVASGCASVLDVFLIRMGRTMSGKGKPLPPHLSKGKPKQCFKNATHLVWRDRELTYCEGYLMIPRIPFLIHHAWCIDESGGIVDNTLDADAHLYYGMEFSLEVLNDELLKSGTYGLLSLHGTHLNRGLMERMNPGVNRETRLLRKIASHLHQQIRA